MEYTRIYTHHKTNKKFSFLIFAFLIIVSVGMWTRIHKPQPIISPIVEQIEPTQKVKQSKPFIALFSKKKSPQELLEKIDAAVTDTVKNYSVLVDDLTTPFTAGVSENEIYIAASVNKIPILAALYYYAEKGDIDLDEVITLQASDIQDYGTGSLRYESPGATYSIKTLAKLMIKQSDNTAAYILANHIIGFDKLQAIVDQWGLTQTDMTTENKTSNKDMATLFRMIYENKIATKAHTEEMLSFFKDTDFETRLPALLPEGVTVYHKIGSEVRNVHDVGIVTFGKVAYYIGVFTNEITDDQEAEKTIATISQVVYEYMNR